MATLDLEFRVKGFSIGQRQTDNMTLSITRLEKTVNNIDFSTLGKKLENISSLFKNASKSVNDFKGTVTKTANLGSGVQGYTDSLNKANVALVEQKRRTEESRTATQKARQANAELTLSNRKNKLSVDAVSGSYREAQQRLTLLGNTIKNTAGGFRNMTPAVRAQIAEYRTLNGQLKAFDAAMGNHQRNVGNYNSALSSLAPQLSQFAGKGGALLIAAYAARSAYKAVSEFDSGMRNVEKTTGLTRKEVDKLGVEFVNLSKRLKTVSSNNITQYATIAGQLGVKGSRDILAFTESLAKLETATNISGEEGGAEIARTLTLIDGGVQNVKSFSDEIVNLGNNFAATEKEILSNAESIAQNVGIYKIGRQDVLAYATATKSVGIEAELVGSTFNRTLAIFERSIRTGNGVKSILDLIGGSQAQLSKRFKTDASGVFMDFIGALNRIYKSGGSVNEQLEKIGVDAVRDQRVLQSLAANGFDVLTRAMETAKNSAGALDSEFETASGKMTNQMNRVKVSVENLWLSMEQGTGIIGKLSVAFANASADIIDGFTNIVTSRSFKEFIARMGELSSDGTIRAISNAYGNTVKAINENTNTTPRGLVSFKEMKSFYDSTAKSQKEQLKDQATIVKAQIQEWRLNKDNLKIRENMLWNAEKMTKMLAVVNKGKDITVPIVNTTSTTGGGDEGGNKGSKNQTKISDILNDLTGIRLNSYDAQISKIGLEYDKLVEKIKASTGSGADIAQALNLAGAKKDFDTLKVEVSRFIDEVKKVPGFKGNNSVSITGQLNASSLPGLAQAQDRIGKLGRIVQSKDDKDLEKKLGRVVERGFRQGIDSLYDNIADLGSNFQEVFSNAFKNLSGNFSKIFQDMLATQLGDSFNKAFDSDKFQISGISNKISKALVAGASIAGGLISSISSQKSYVGQGVGGALSGAASGAAAGAAIGSKGGIWGAVAGGLIGALSGIFGASSARRQEKIQEQQLLEQKRQTALLERQSALAFTSSIIGQKTNQGIVTGVERNEFGDVVFEIEGRKLKAVLDREQSAQGRGVF